MNIGIDARLYGLEHTGIGRYIQNLIVHLGHIDKKNHYVIFLKTKYYQTLQLPKNFSKAEVNIKHYTLAEQIKFPAIINHHSLDLIHFPHFNVPILTSVPFIVTVHDLLWHKVKGADQSTLPSWLYSLKYFGYKFVVNQALTRSRAIIVPSEWVREQILKEKNEVDDKIYAIYEGVDQKLTKSAATLENKTRTRLGINDPYIVFTGSAYPHKNVRRLIEATKIASTNLNQPIKLVLISSRSVFLDQLIQYVKINQYEKYVVFAGFLQDAQLAAMYSQAKALVHPSLSEGFGLTGLEAMSLGVPVIASNAGSLPEVYGQASIYFDPTKVLDIADKIVQVLSDPSLQKKLMKKGYAQAAKFSWNDTAKQTLELYQQVSKHFLKGL